MIILNEKISKIKLVTTMRDIIMTKLTINIVAIIVFPQSPLCDGDFRVGSQYGGRSFVNASNTPDQPAFVHI